MLVFKNPPHKVLYHSTLLQALEVGGQVEEEERMVREHRTRMQELNTKLQELHELMAQVKGVFRLTFFCTVQSPTLRCIILYTYSTVV